MDSLIQVMNELQAIFKKTQTTSQQESIQLPQIVVVGSQSCGKSSVLESLVGKSFLPRGTGIVTRCPIILQLVHLEPSENEEEGEIEEWCTFPSSDDPERKYEDFDKVREMIENQTNEMAGGNKGISMDPITVIVCSPNVLSLTVVDLPGVVKISTGRKIGSKGRATRLECNTRQTRDRSLKQREPTRPRSPGQHRHHSSRSRSIHDHGGLSIRDESRDRATQNRCDNRSRKQSSPCRNRRSTRDRDWYSTLDYSYANGRHRHSSKSSSKHYNRRDSPSADYRRNAKERSRMSTDRRIVQSPERTSSRDRWKSSRNWKTPENSAQMQQKIIDPRPKSLTARRTYKSYNAVGDQPEDIEDQVLELIKEYIENPNAIILAISPGNADIATSESLKIAKEVDPKGDRTLAVITKLDMMDKGTDATAVLAGQVIQVKLGIIGVVNRSQFAITNSETIEMAMKNEKDFLEKHYPRQIGQIGSPYLAKRLSELLMKHIQNSLPDLIKRIIDMTEEYEKRKNKLGPKVADGGPEKMWAMMEIIHNFCQEYTAAIKDRASATAEDDVIFTLQITNTYDRFNASLRNLDDVFKSLVKQQILLMERPSIACAEAVHGILSRAVEHCLKDKRVELLNAEICRVTRILLSEQLKLVKISIREYMEIQTGMICSIDEDFIKLLKLSDNGIVEPGEKRKFCASFPLGTTIDCEDNDQSKYVQNLIAQYFNVMRKQIADYIPKHILHHLFERSIAMLKDTIKNAVAGKQNDLISESETVIRKRQETDDMLHNLYQATKIVNGIQSKYLMTS